MKDSENFLHSDAPPLALLGEEHPGVAESLNTLAEIAAAQEKEAPVLRQ